MESLGDYLKREREYRNISLEEISRTTKIREDILTAFEEDRFDSRVSPVFIKGFLKAYASYVGLNPDDVVLRYEASLREEKEQTAKEAFGDTPKQWILKYVVFPISALLVIGILLFLILEQPRIVETAPESQQIEEPVTQSISEADSTSPVGRTDGDSILASHSDPKEIPANPPPRLPSPAVTPPRPKPPSSVEIQLRAIENTWIRIQIDQEAAVEILLKQGQEISRQGKRNIDMTVGNAGGLEILHNGKNFGKLGESGEVVYLSISPEEIKTRKPGSSPSDRP